MGSSKARVPPLPVVVVGAGAMGREWIRMLASSHLASLVGIVDLDIELAKLSAAQCGIPGVAVASRLSDICGSEDVAAVVNVTVPQAHGVINEQALRAGMAVLCEKPLADNLTEAIRQVAVADVTGGLLMVSQSRRYFNHLSAYREVARQLGPLAVVTAEFFHEDHEPGFRELMDDPLLVDMSVHHFDMLRLISQDAPIAVRCSSWNPPWSWFAGNAVASAEFELLSGARFVYSGSRCTPGLRTSWNADWKLYAQRGAASWDGDDMLQIGADGISFSVGSEPEGIEGAFAHFWRSVQSEVAPETEVRLNLVSLAMVVGSVMSSRRDGERIVLADLMNDALREAQESEMAPDVREVLASWRDIDDVLTSQPWGQTVSSGPGGDNYGK
jgi:predicted dehydrogenase